MITIEKLKELGANTEEGLERCMDDEEFYLSLIPSALERERYEALEAQIKEDDFDTAFETAHALKGVLANMALTTLSDVVGQITELLRSRENTDYSPYIADMWEQFDKFDKAVKG